jgi:hypothetical protein
MTSRTYILTINNPTYSIESKYDSEKMQYIGGQLEKGENGTPHL